jgi:protein-S-isoprenylcysteine O-methyltransferase Ste14
MSSDTSIEPSGNRAETNRAVIRWLVREIMGLVMLALLLFFPAGRWDWWAGWAMVGVMGLWVLATALVLIPRNPELLAERIGPKQGSKEWDTAIMSTTGLLMLVKCLLAGFDVRYRWTTGISLPVQVTTLVITGLGYALVVWATAANAFFSQIVRIQKERGHTVVTSGPYRFVRHPGYVGTILVELATPLMLGSWWAFIPGAIAAILYIVRTALEDRTLQAELDGYPAYARQVRFRLLPRIW